MFLPHEIYNYTSENAWTSSFDINVFIKSLYDIFNCGLKKQHNCITHMHSCFHILSFLSASIT